MSQEDYVNEAGEAYVEMRNIVKRYGDFVASDDVSFEIARGQLVALLGPSGSGKSTILRMIAGLETPNAGDIFIAGRRVNDVTAAKREIGFVFQSYALFRYMTVAENIGFGLKLQKVPKAEIAKRVEELLAIIGLEGLGNRYPNQLSGGQRQRVAFARALAPNPRVLLLYEPFAAIDAKVRAELRLWLRQIVVKLGITSIFVTHDQEEAVEVADQIVVTNHGRVEQVGTPAEIYQSPKTPFVAQFIGRSTLVDNYTRLKGFAALPGVTQAVMRPEFVRVFRVGTLQHFMSAAQRGIVRDVVFRGDHLDVTVEVEGLSLFSEWSLEQSPLRLGEEVDVLVHRLYAIAGDQITLLENANMKAADGFII